MLGIQMYSQDYDGMCLHYCNTDPGTDERLWWHNVLPYVKNKQIFVCPSEQYASFESRWTGGEQKITVGYGMPIWITPTNPRSMDQAPNPAELLYIVDASNMTVDDSSNAKYWAYVKMRHNEGANVGWFDGHAKWESTGALAGHPEWWDIALNE